VTILPFGIAWRGIKKIVLDPSILPPTPWARNPNSFAAALFQTGNVVSACISWRSKLDPVAWLMKVLDIGIWLNTCWGAV
jgi:hypothetical protein